MQHTCKDPKSLKKYVLKNEKTKIIKEKKFEVKEGFEERAHKALLTF